MSRAAGFGDTCRLSRIRRASGELVIAAEANALTGPNAAPQRRRWRVADPYSGGSIQIAGLDWGGGDKPLAILSHANGFCAAMWALVAEQLAADYRVIALDARGHGDSDAPPAPDGYVWDYFVSDLNGVAEQLLEELGQPRVAFGIGNSFGGIVTAAAEAAHNGRFERIAMLDPPIHPTPELMEALGLEPSPRRPNVTAEQARKRTSVWPSRDVARNAWGDRPMFASWQPRAFDLYLEEGFRDREDGQVELKCDPSVEATIFATTGSLDTFEFAPRVPAPVLLVRAALGFFPAEIFDYLAGRFPNCTLVQADAGHLMPLENPDLVIELLKDFAD